MSIRSVWLEQTPLTLGFGRGFRTSSTGLLLQSRVQSLSRLNQENSSVKLFSDCHRQVHLRTYKYSSETSKPTRQSVRGKTVSKEAKDSSNNGKKTEKETKVGEQTVIEESKLTLYQRFKKAYKEHAKILVGVHLVTSAVWFGSFFYAAHMGVDIIPLLQKLGLSEKIITPFRSSSLGDVALAYLMYKLATPARYTVTLAGTNYAIKFFRKAGKVPAKQKGLMKEAVQFGSTQTRRHVTNRYTNVKRRWEISRLKMRRDARHFSTRLKTRFQNVRKSKTLKAPNGVQREKIIGRKSSGQKS